MANNRMYLRCKGCGEEFFIGKRFADGYHIGQYDQYKGVPLIERLNKFYSDHVWCGNAGLDCFELIYEDPPEPHIAADVRPVVRGEWIDAMKGCHDSPHVKCSVCGEYYWRYFKKFSFCPNCGADMREDEA